MNAELRIQNSKLRIYRGASNRIFFLLWKKERRIVCKTHTFSPSRLWKRFVLYIWWLPSLDVNSKWKYKNKFIYLDLHEDFWVHFLFVFFLKYLLVCLTPLFFVLFFHLSYPEHHSFQKKITFLLHHFL